MDSNYAVVKPPGRQFPGAVILGVVTWFRNQGPTDDPEVLGDVQELTELLVRRVLHYQEVLQAHGIELSHSQPVA